jgi:hypothetical protein
VDLRGQGEEELKADSNERIAGVRILVRCSWNLVARFYVGFESTVVMLWERVMLKMYRSPIDLPTSRSKSRLAKLFAFRLSVFSALRGDPCHLHLR